MFRNSTVHPAVRGARFGALALVCALALGACASTGASNTGARNGGTGGQQLADLAGDWQLVRAADASGQFEINGATVTLSIDAGSSTSGGEAPSSTIGGTAACNHYGGAASMENGVLQVGEIHQTEMYCMGAGLMELEARYLAALGIVSSAEVTDDLLVLAGDAVELEFESVPPVPEEELLDTTWRLESLIEGLGDDGTASSVPGEYTLVLGIDGTFAAEGGCPPYSGRYAVNGGQVNTTESGIDGNVACLVHDPVQDHVMQVIRGAFRVQIERDVMTATQLVGDLGLVYRAVR